MNMICVGEETEQKDQDYLDALLTWKSDSSWRLNKPNPGGAGVHTGSNVQARGSAWHGAAA